MALAEHINGAIASILGLSQKEDKSYPFRVLDSEPEKGIYLVHYDVEKVREEEDPTVLTLRGVVVDINSTIVAESFGYTPEVKADSIIVGEDGLVKLTDTDGVERVFEAESASFQPMFQGTLLRVYRSYGKTYFSTHKKLDASKSHWGSSAYFVDLYKSLGGPSEEELFDLSKQHSPYCHMFMVVHRDLMVTTKMPMTEDGGFVLYLGSAKEYSHPDETEEEGLPATKYNPETVDWESHFELEDSGTGEVEPDFTVKAGKIRFPATFSLEDANAFLHKGYHQTLKIPAGLDPRLLPGEAVLCRYKMEDGSEALLKINPACSVFRDMIVGNNPNGIHRAFELLTKSYYPRGAEVDTYDHDYPILGHVTTDVLSDIAKELGDNAFLLPPKLEGSKAELLDPRDKESRNLRFGNLMLLYALSLPIYWQMDALGYMDEVYRRRATLITFICNNFKEIHEGKFGTEGGWKRMQAIAGTAYDNAKNRLERGEQRSITWFVKDNLRNFLQKEAGVSLYKMVKEYERYMSPKPAPSTPPAAGDSSE
jgi:hypothetical protein